MSSRIVLNTWSGSDQDLAAEKMARVFRMTEARSAAIIQQLLGGRNWEFEHKVSDPQARTA
ncbi:MAG: hypothetical protein GWM98_04455, partial [Nitrospinaceae bacterium]|nr:hypothetical protein [Nitrospinaceae bacterium]NIR53894.1 hypothetical protein [Nitrospinaceae bacterium]NIS84308.1 hypothetical protein [Nitrospinaceae bacterium]NIT81115.1 hypothetical protein [Nitrospinaceae bacterium]NIU43397.1 hypothetical protein [Nitrospinaceae bacterium]